MMRDRLVFLLGLGYGIIFPPGLTSFLLVVLYSLFSAGSPLLLDPGAVVSDFPLYVAGFIVPEIVLAALLSRSKAQHLGRWLVVFSGINLVLGVLAYLSMLTCGTC
jgi:hypothetical protein